jgi:hypothetical protein
MAGTSSPSIYIKHEPEEQSFGVDQNDNYRNQNHQGLSMPHHNDFHQYGEENGGDSIDPSALTMPQGSGSAQNGNFMQSYPSFGSSQNLAFLGNAGIADDELLDLGSLDDMNPAASNYPHQQHGSEAPTYPNDGGVGQNMYGGHAGSVSMNQPINMNQVYSQTPDGAPIQSPFVQSNFNYDQFRPMPHGHGFDQQHEGSFTTSPRVAHEMPRGSFENSYMNAKPRSRMHSGLERKTSQSRSPMTPKTPGIGVSGINLGTPDSGSLPSQPIHTHHLAQHRHQKSLSNQWDSTPGSMQSFVESPISSPGQPSHHAQISEILKSGKHASLPAKVENGHHTGPAPAFQTQEAKRRRRRESHNMVERRRRDNINERIQELSHLVPQHRLEDEKVRKHLMNNSPLSPTLGATGMSPPQATSLLAGGNGRRAAGNITTGIPVEDKDKGPNKGDILNGSVSWTRDLMWALYAKIQQESQLAEYIHSIGGDFPFEQTEEDKRMRTELLDAIDKNGADNFAYTRGPGSGLRVPKHTNVAGDPVNSSMNQATLSPQSLSPAGQSGGSGSASINQGQYWNGHQSGGSGQGSISFKEEDEYGMDIS